jgi:predicted transcriptional regulator
MSNKETVKEILRNLPEEATLEEIVEHIQILAAIRRGKEDIATGRYVPHEEAKNRLEQWLSE